MKNCVKLNYQSSTLAFKHYLGRPERFCLLYSLIDLRPIGDLLYSNATTMEPSAANITPYPLVTLAPTTNNALGVQKVNNMTRK